MKRNTPPLTDPGWKKILENEMNLPYFQDLMDFVAAERANNEVYPPHDLVFYALNLTPFDQVNVVIVGQDPYHGPGQAHGLSFSVPQGVKIPPSLRNIFKELQSDLKVFPPHSGSLVGWARQGVLLLNSTLTVSRSKPLSHHGKGWERFTDFILKELIKSEKCPIFVLWGEKAKCKVVDIQKFKTKNPLNFLQAPHPSPFAARRGFFGSHPFSKINEILIEEKKAPIRWENFQ